MTAECRIHEEELHAVVHGTVQMVMFRQFVFEQARELGLVGTVRNTNDGTVEVVAQGSAANLKALLQCLHSGPKHAEVEKVDVEWCPPRESFDEFTIIY